MKVKPRTVLVGLAAIAAILVAVVAGVLIGRPSDDQAAVPGATTTPTTVDGPPSTKPAEAATTTTSSVPRSTTTAPPAPPEAADDRLDGVPKTLTKIDRSDPEAVAGAWCAYWTHDLNETAEQWANRLAPISTVSMFEALADLNFPDEQGTRREASPGALEPLNGDRWMVNCATRTVTANGEPTGPPEPTTALISLVKGDDAKWAVAAADVGGLVLPDGIGQN